MKMSLIRSLAIVTLLILSTSNNTLAVNAKSHEQKQLEEFVKGNNYNLAEDATKQYEQKNDTKISLPKKLPFEPSHRFGHIDEEGRLKLHYMKYDKNGKYHTLDFIFYVMSETEIESHVTSNDKVYSFENGDKAYYRQNPNDFHTLAFKKHGLGYFLGGCTTDNFNLEVLFEIAESI
jgi:hypothetical protein